MDADADPETISSRSPWPVDEVAEYRTAGLTPLRTRQLAAFFTAQAVRCQGELRGVDIEDYTAEQRTAQGKLNAYVPGGGAVYLG